MKKLTIFVDMDGTIERLLDVWLERLNNQYGLSVSSEDITEWDMTKFYPTLLPEQVFEPIYDDSIWKEVEPIEGANDVIKKWIAEGHSVYIVTATPYETIKSKMEDLLFRCFPDLTWKNVIVTENKHLLKGDVMIDDGVHNLIGGNYRKLLFDAPYNRNISDEEFGIVRVHDWYEVEHQVEIILQSSIC